jgi:FMNH2-dependent dimethyl sulfone monooxygenase
MPSPETTAIRAFDAASPLGQALRQPMLIGLFLPIHNGGWTMSTLPRGTDWTFAYNARLTQRSEALGFDLVFGPAHWLPKGGFGGETNYRETSMDAFIAVSALAAVTQRILLISTIHILYGPWHPLHLAKFGATIDHISGGRWGLNVVAGFRGSEREMFGMAPIDHDKRYALAGEFTELMLRLWSSDENVSHAGEFWRLKDAFITPKPIHGRPIMVNATGSPSGIAYAARYSDLVFITSSAGAQIEAALDVLPAHNATIKRAAGELGRSVRTIINPMILCRETEREARDLYDAIQRRADDGALDGFMHSHAVGDSRSWRGHQRAERAVGGNIQLIGTPEQIVDQLLRLKAAGCDGIQICFFDYEPELEFFGSRVLPLMQQAGLRL